MFGESGIFKEGRGKKEEHDIEPLTSKLLVLCPINIDG